jgi:hypothetical protein
MAMATLAVIVRRSGGAITRNLPTMDERAGMVAES